jgi:hypothetical protein
MFAVFTSPPGPLSSQAREGESGESEVPLRVQGGWQPKVAQGGVNRPKNA